MANYNPSLHNFQDMTGRQCGKLAIMSRAANSSTNRAQWLCRCECGKMLVIAGKKLRNGHTKSCGCLRKEIGARNGLSRRKHGASHSREYETWNRMKQRCHNPDNQNYLRYGDRGIYTCQRWHSSFTAFLQDMGKIPSSEHSLDRINNEQGYNCGHCSDCLQRGVAFNCRWATTKQQARNRRSNRKLTFQGKTASIIEWSEIVKIAPDTIQKRLEAGWSIKEVLTLPISRTNRRFR